MYIGDQMSKKKKSASHKPTLIDKLPRNLGEWLKVVIDLTERAIFDRDLSTDKLLVYQLEKLNKQLEDWKKANIKQS